MVDLDTEEWKIVFDTFLDKYNCRESYYRNAKNEGHEDPYDFILGCFDWEETERPCNFWSNLYRRWEDVLSDGAKIVNATKLACKIYPDASIIEKDNKKYIVII